MSGPDASARAQQSQLAHDLGNSIGAVSLHLQVLAGAATTPGQREGFAAATRQIRIATAQLMQLRQLIKDSS